jgi:uncharacterized protein YyaL (SSP411 family)
MPAHTNALIHETSPYLQQHAHNPVNWLPWGEEAFRQARERDVPILLSVGYSSCHWCHVMERESFENEAIAQVMNDHFVCIKVDREERPDVDQIYMSAVQTMTGQGGWPMTVLLTHDGKPFYGGTYYPPDDRYGRPGFPRLLMALHDAWTNKRSEIEEQGAALVEHIAASAASSVTESAITPNLFSQAVTALNRNFDSDLGGFGDAPKFPAPMILDFLLMNHRRTGRTDAQKMATFTLDKMAQGGLRDHLGGGFHRYSVDAYWLVPHFEKMLYDNAQLSACYLHAWQATGNENYRRVAEETLDFVRREMTAPDGGFYSALDADSDDEHGQSEEGAYYVWKPRETKEILGEEDAALFARVYDITPRGNFEGKNIPNLGASLASIAKSLNLTEEQLDEKLAGIRARLLVKRETRPRPFRDEKIVTAWNGLMLSAFAQAAGALDRADYRQTAVNNAEFVLRELYRDGALLRTGIAMEPDMLQNPTQREYHFKASSIPGFLEDYACYADALLHLYEATFERRWLDVAIELAETMIEKFADPAGGFFDTASDAEILITRPKDTGDNATPCGNSVACGLLLRLAVHLDRDDFRQRAATWLRQSSSMIERYPSAFGRLLQAGEHSVTDPMEIVIAGDSADPQTHNLAAITRRAYLPTAALAHAQPNDPQNEASPLLQGKSPINGQPAAYACQNYACQAPITDPQVLREALR